MDAPSDQLPYDIIPLGNGKFEFVRRTRHDLQDLNRRPIAEFFMTAELDRGECIQELGRIDTDLAERPMNLVPLVSKAHIHEFLGGEDLWKMLDVANNIVRFHKERPEGYRLRAVAYLRLGHASECVEELEDFLVAFPQNNEIRLVLSHILNTYGEKYTSIGKSACHQRALESAELAIEESVRTGKTVPDIAFAEKAIALHELGQYENALSALDNLSKNRREKVSNISNEEWHWLYYRPFYSFYDHLKGRILLDLDQSSDEQVNVFLDMVSDCPIHWVDLATIYYDIGKDAESEAAIDKLFRDNDCVASPSFEVAITILFELKKYKKAMEYLSREKGRRTNNPSFLALCAQCARLNKQYNESLSYVENALRIDPNDPDALFESANAHLAKDGISPKVESLFLRAISKDSAYEVSAYMDLSLAYFGNEDQKAIPYLELGYQAIEKALLEAHDMETAVDMANLLILNRLCLSMAANSVGDKVLSVKSIDETWEMALNMGIGSNLITACLGALVRIKDTEEVYSFLKQLLEDGSDTLGTELGPFYLFFGETCLNMHKISEARDHLGKCKSLLNTIEPDVLSVLVSIWSKPTEEARAEAIGLLNTMSSPDGKRSGVEIFTEEQVKGLLSHLIGSICVIKHEYEDAITHLLDAATYLPSDHLVQSLIADSYLELNQKKKALEHIEKAIALDPDNQKYLDAKHAIVNDLDYRPSKSDMNDVVIQATNIKNQFSSLKSELQTAYSSLEARSIERDRETAKSLKQIHKTVEDTYQKLEKIERNWPRYYEDWKADNQEVIEKKYLELAEGNVVDKSVWDSLSDLTREFLVTAEVFFEQFGPLRGYDKGAIAIEYGKVVEQELSELLTPFCRDQLENDVERQKTMKQLFKRIKNNKALRLGAIRVLISDENAKEKVLFEDFLLCLNNSDVKRWFEQDLKSMIGEIVGIRNKGGHPDRVSLEEVTMIRDFLLTGDSAMLRMVYLA